MSVINIIYAIIDGCEFIYSSMLIHVEYVFDNLRANIQLNYIQIVVLYKLKIVIKN